MATFLGGKAEGDEAEDVLVDADGLAPLPAHPPHGMGLHIGDGGIGIAALLLVPDDLIHDHHMAEMSPAGGHEAAHHRKGLMPFHGGKDRLVAPVAEDDLAPHIGMGMLKLA